MLTITNGADYLPQVKELIIEYTGRLNRDLSFQHLNEELEHLAEKYTAPNGELLAAVENGTVLGMAACRRLDAARCEMKRLYVKPEARGMHLGEQLIRNIMEHAAAAGYTEMVLDTIHPLQTAIYLYRKSGFTECEPYYENPMAAVIYMSARL